MLIMSGDVASSSGTDAVLVDGLMYGSEHMRIAAHAKIIIRTPYGHTIIGAPTMSERELLGESIDAVEIAVRPVLLFDGNLLLAKRAVIEACISGGLFYNW